MFSHVPASVFLKFLGSNFNCSIEHRFVLGMMNGITPAIRTAVHEICGKCHVVQAMAYIDGEGQSVHADCATFE